MGRVKGSCVLRSFVLYYLWLLLYFESGRKEERRGKEERNRNKNITTVVAISFIEMQEIK